MELENARIVIWQDYRNAEPEVDTFDGQSVEVTGAAFHKTTGAQGDTQRTRQGGEIRWTGGAAQAPSDLVGKQVKVIDEHGTTVLEGEAGKFGMVEATRDGDLIIPTA